MASRTCSTIQEVPVIHAVVDENVAVAAWVIELFPEYALTVFVDGRQPTPPEARSTSSMAKATEVNH